MADPQDFIKRLGVMKANRSNFDTIWDQVKRVVWPDGDDFLEKRSDGERTTREVYEGTAANALETFGSAMESFLTPRHLRWHGLKASKEELNQNKEVKEFFEKVTTLVFKVREAPKARFYGQMNEVIKGLGAYGNGCLFVDEARGGKGIRYKSISISKAWIEVDYQGVVDSITYEYRLTAKAAKQKWPHDVPEKAVLAMERGNDFEEHTYLHVVRPNFDADPESVVPEGMPYQVWDVCVDGNAIIKQPDGTEMGGYFEMPYLWTRFTLNPNEIYGRGPAMLTLSDILTLQDMEKTFLRSGHKVADPPLMTAHDGRMGRGRRKIRLNPGGLNYGAVDANGRPKIIPLVTGARLDMTEAMMEKKRTMIETVFFLPLFDILAKDRVEMTATEVIERSREKGQLITPVVGRQQSELLGPLIEREIAILQRQGQLPEFPAALVEAEGEFEIEYDTLATRMQQSDELAAYQRLFAAFQPNIELDPGLARVFKSEDAIRVFGETSGIRMTLFNSKEEMDEIHEQDEAQEGMAALAQQGPGISQTAKTLSEIPGDEEPQQGAEQA